MIEKGVEQNYDGEIVVVVDDDFVLTDCYPAIVSSRSSLNTGVFTSMPVARALSARAELGDAERLGDKKELRYRRKMSAFFDRVLKENADAELVELILEGRLQVAFLLNSLGGDVDALDLYRDMLDYVVRKKGEAQAYVTEVAGSAGCDMVADVDRAYVLDGSILAWHRTLDMMTNEVVESERDLDLLELGGLLSKANEEARPRLIGKVRKALADKENPDSLVGFSGIELAGAGCVERSFAEVAEMRKFFSQQFWAADHQLVKTFWKARPYGG